MAAYLANLDRIAERSPNLGGPRNSWIGGQHGFHGMVSSPTLFMAGEHGTRETVDITPIGGSSAYTGIRSNARVAGAGSTLNVNIHFNGPVYGNEDLARRLAPDIERELKHLRLLRHG